MKQDKPVYGRRPLGVGIYMVGEPPNAQLEIDIPCLLDHLEMKDTPEIRQSIIEWAEQACTEQGVAVSETLTEHHHHKHFCPRHRANWLHAGTPDSCKQPKRLMCPACQS